MNWVPVYIVGKDGFESDVIHALNNSTVSFMPGYLQDDLQPGEHHMYWVDDQAALREIKKAITAKVIFKYRLRVFKEMNEFLQEHEDVTEDKFTDGDFQTLIASSK